MREVMCEMSLVRIVTIYNMLSEYNNVYKRYTYLVIENIIA